ncbi:ThiF family adenylyltransferase [Aureliella helgolandensis]|uniref:tRNA threonylcarbamoyladenosine dehydratase n=1 Tax=Aureliella helgolandensis TaxID=2527968 RepID=A0A518GE16_9BACT|nr:ThiF family adenylyltransferase [Aureliella helgolandensis]QDV26844.1 tRNA threonylcarbamoyladenosine dehydratase [Aureliella helgolandensis]
MLVPTSIEEISTTQNGIPIRIAQGLQMSSESETQEEIPSVDASWDYETAFSRNLGLVSPEEQQRLRGTRVAIPGMGGVGGIHLMTLARLGVGKFRIADADEFEMKNFNRQFGATLNTIGCSKTQVLADSARGVNPELELDTMNEFVSADNVDRFLDGVDLLVDSVDFFAFKARRMLFNEARRRGIWAITAGPIGFSTAWLLFDPNGMSFDDYFDLHDAMSPVEMFAAFAMGLAPRATHVPYFDFSYVDASGRGPSVAAACHLASGVVGTEAVKILLGRGRLRAAPAYAQFDAYRGLLRQGRLVMGNRNPLQRLKRHVLKKRMLKLGYGQSASST